ncbi:MAG: SH3 domain-containing protein [Defluviitaleaceae bacterium]|nr:SH3 domain-containing protein [Defluviitaleaceae bacterium]
MTWFRNSFEWAGDLYASWFADWLHVSYIIRTIILLLMLWLIIYVGAQIFKFILGPFAVLLYINVFKRAWNFIFVETIQEWIYINYYSKGDLKFSNWYMRLCDKAKANQAMLANSGLKGIYNRGRVRRLGNYLMLCAGLIVALWVGAFGLSQEYAMPAWVGNLPPEPIQTEEYEDDYTDANETNDDYESEENEAPPQEEIYFPGMVRPSLFPPMTQIFLALTDEASEDGARLRDGPGTGTIVIEMIFGNELLMYLGYYAPDEDVETLYWLRVRTPEGTEGFIASHLVSVAH